MKENSLSRYCQIRISRRDKLLVEIKIRKNLASRRDELYHCLKRIKSYKKLLVIHLKINNKLLNNRRVYNLLVSLRVNQ